MQLFQAAIITISAVRTKDVADESELESYWSGKLAAEIQPMFVPNYFWTELKISQHKPAIFGEKQSGGSGNADGF